MAIKILAAMFLGIIIAFGLRSRSSSYSLMFAVSSCIGIIIITGIYYEMGENIFDLLKLKIPSKTTPAIFILYSGVIGGLLSSISPKNKKRNSGSE